MKVFEKQIMYNVKCNGQKVGLDSLKAEVGNQYLQNTMLFVFQKKSNGNYDDGSRFSYICRT